MLSKAILFHPKHIPFAPSHNLLSTKEHGHSFAVRSKSLRCNARTSHRFKAFSPPFCAKSRVRHVPPESSAEIFFDRALNRGRRTESRVLFGYFLHNAKSDKPYPFAGSFEVLQTSNQHTKQQLRTNPIKFFSAPRPFRRLRRLLFPTFCKVQKVGQKTFPPYGGVPAGTARSACIAPPLAA